MNGWQTVKGWLALCADTVLRLGFGAMFIYAARSKIEDPWTFQTMVENYRMLPSSMTEIFAVTFSVAELLVGAMFLFTKWTREAAFATAVMLVMFIVALAQAKIRGLDVSCGCFGRESRAVIAAIIRDVALVVPAVWLVVKGQRRWIADFRRIWYTCGK